MTATFIENALSELNESQNTWTTLHGKAQRIGLMADNNISIDPRYRSFYFDESSEMLYITYYDGVLIAYQAGDEIPDGYVIMTINGKQYLNKVSKNAINCTLGGSSAKIHAAISYDKIVGFYFPNVNPQSYIDELSNY